jgi:hypothetical protein
MGRAVGDAHVISRVGGIAALESLACQVLFGPPFAGEESFEAHSALCVALADGSLGPVAAQEFADWSLQTLPYEAERLGNLVAALAHVSPTKSSAILRRIRTAANSDPSRMT